MNKSITELSECKVEAICDHFIDPPSFIIFSNYGDGCSDKAQLELECVSNSINEICSSAIKVFPNPAKAFLMLDIPQNTRIQWIKMYNTQSKAFDMDIHQNRINMAALCPGMYFGQVMVDANLHHFTVVKN